MENDKLLSEENDRSQARYDNLVHAIEFMDCVTINDCNDRIPSIVSVAITLLNCEEEFYDKIMMIYDEWSDEQQNKLAEAWEKDLESGKITFRDQIIKDLCKTHKSEE